MIRPSITRYPDAAGRSQNAAQDLLGGHYFERRRLVGEEGAVQTPTLYWGEKEHGGELQTGAEGTGGQVQRAVWDAPAVCELFKSVAHTVEQGADRLLRLTVHPEHGTVVSKDGWNTTMHTCSVGHG